MTATLQDSAKDVTEQDAAEVFSGWLADFAAAVESGSASGLAALFLEGATWRDFMALPWAFHHTVGRDETVSRFLELARAWNAADFTVSQEQSPVVADGSINAFFDFTTEDRIDR